MVRKEIPQIGFLQKKGGEGWFQGCFLKDFLSFLRIFILYLML